MECCQVVQLDVQCIYDQSPAVDHYIISDNVWCKYNHWLKCVRCVVIINDSDGDDNSSSSGGGGSGSGSGSGGGSGSGSSSSSSSSGGSSSSSSSSGGST